MQPIKKIIYVYLSLLLFGCSTDSKKLEHTSEPVVTAEEIDAKEPDNTPEEIKLTIVLGDNKNELLSYYEIPWIKEFYEDQLQMPYQEYGNYKVPEDLSTLSYGDLRLLRNEVFARNGYLFSDGFLRGYFNKNKWYMPIFDVDTFKVVMSQAEQDLVNRLLKEEAVRKKNLYVDREEGLKLFNADLIVNEKQFKLSLRS